MPEESGQQSPSLKHRSKSKIRICLSVLLIIITVCWLGKLIYQDREDISAMFNRIGPGHVLTLTLSTLTATFAIGLLLILFQTIFRINTKVRLGLFHLGHIFFISQIVRYLPGRVFGIAYQIHQTYQRIPAAKIIRTNFEFMAFIIFFNSLASAAILTNHFYGAAKAGGLLVLGLVVFYYILRLHLLNRILTSLHDFIPKPLASFSKNLQQNEPYTPGEIFKILSVLILYFTLYCFSWSLLKDFFNEFSGYDLVLLCALYTLSWLVGFLSMLTPSGIGVREAAFLVLTSRIFPQYPMVILAVFIRLWLIVIDIALFFINYFFYKTTADSRVFENP